jgi:hypothetical protein
MTPKEKADEVYVGYWYLTNDSRIAKQCALIAVDEILKSHNNLYGVNSEKIKFYLEVKTEIEKL